MSAKRMTANPVKAPRHRPGVAVLEEDSDSDSDTSQVSAEVTAPQPSKPGSRYTSAGGIASNLSKVDLNERRKKAAETEAARIAEEKALRAKEEEGFVTEESEEESEDGSDEDSGSEEEESEEEAPRKVLMRPTFIKKDKRKANGGAVEEAQAEDERLAAEEERRKKAADEIVEEQIRKDIAAKAAGKKNWDDEEDDEEEVDDTDDLDPEAEHAAWKLRELRRIKRDREAIEQREKELEEVERRKNLTEEERKAEDEEFLAKQKEEKDSKGKMGYMQKYYHKGAFFQDDAKAEGLDRRDIMGSRFADDVQNRELLPQALQMRDMTKLGKKGATKYKDLKSEDTGQWARFDDRRPRPGNAAAFGTDERFMPDKDRGPSGANNMPVGERKQVANAPDGPRAMRKESDTERDGGDTYRPDRRSRSPRRDRHAYDRGPRKRSSSRDRDRYESDKRRRMDSR